MLDFPVEKIKIDPCYLNFKVLNSWKEISPEKVVPEKVREVYGEVDFPPAPDIRPYTVSSLVLSMDGRIGFQDQAAGPLVAKGNERDPDGALADFWVLNMLRAYSDAVIVGARTLQVEKDGYAWICDGDLIRDRIEVLGKKNVAPINIVVSYDGTDIPVDHTIFKCPDVEIWIATSPRGAEYLRQVMPYPLIILENPFKDHIYRVKEEGTIPIVVTGREDSTDTQELLRALRLLGIKRLLAESPTFVWHLLHTRQLDEIFWNFSGVIAGGSVLLGQGGAFTLENHPHCELLFLGRHRSHFIFTRQKLYYF
ncbi:dihydrofolate reductase family protein [Moorellaceae bacterium AZ2]